MSYAKQNKDIDTSIWKNIALHELQCSVVTKGKLSVVKLVYAPILPSGRKSWLMSERLLPHVQSTHMAFLQW